MTPFLAVCDPPWSADAGGGGRGAQEHYGLVGLTTRVKDLEDKQAQKPTSAPPPPRARAFFGSIDVNATTAKMKLVSVAEEVIALLAADPNATVKVTVEISAEFPNGATDQTKRAVTENAGALGFKSKSWE